MNVEHALRFDTPFCPKCSYPTSADHDVCPECGLAIGKSSAPFIALGDKFHGSWRRGVAARLVAVLTTCWMFPFGFMAMLDLDHFRTVIWLGAACVLGTISIYANWVYVRRCSVSPIVFLEVAICGGALVAYGFIAVESDGQFSHHGTRDVLVMSAYAVVVALGTALQATLLGGLGDRLQNYTLRKVLVAGKICLYGYAAVIAPTFLGFGCPLLVIEFPLAILLLIAASIALAIAMQRVLVFP